MTAAAPIEASSLTGIVRDAQAGSGAAQRALFDRYQAGVLSYCTVASNGRRDIAVDLTQEVFAQAFRNIVQVREPERFAGWLFTICAHRCQRHGQAEQRQRAILEQFALEQESSTVVDDADANKARLELLRSLVAQVDDPALREIVLLKYGEPEHTTRTIAERMQIPHGTVTVKLMRFRALLRRQLLAALVDQDAPEVA